MQISERIETLRYQQSKVPTPGQVKREIDDNNKDAMIASLKRKIKKLEEDNKQLIEELKNSIDKRQNWVQYIHMPIWEYVYIEK